MLTGMSTDTRRDCTGTGTDLVESATARQSGFRLATCRRPANAETGIRAVRPIISDRLTSAECDKRGHTPKWAALHNPK